MTDFNVTLALFTVAAIILGLVVYHHFNEGRKRGFRTGRPPV